MNKMNYYEIYYSNAFSMLDKKMSTHVSSKEVQVRFYWDEYPGQDSPLPKNPPLVGKR